MSTIYTLEDLLKMYEEGTLPSGEKVFKYKTEFNLEKWMHIDELEREIKFKHVYRNYKFTDRFRGMINMQYDNKPPVNDNADNS